MREKFNTSGLKVDSEDMTLTPMLDDAQMRLEFAIAGFQVTSKKMTSTDRSTICETNIPVLKLSKISEAVLTSKEKDCVPYWNDFCAGISSSLWLPIKTDSRVSGLNAFSIWSNKTVERSWFATHLISVQNKNLPMIFSPSSTCSLVGSTESEVTKARKIRLYPTTSQKQIMKHWFGVSRYVYNKTLEYLQQPGTKANWMEIKKWLIKSLPKWADNVPYLIKAEAVRDCCKAVKKAKQDYRLTGKVHEVHQRRRHDPQQSCFIFNRAIKEKGIYYTMSGLGLRYAEKLPSTISDSRLILRNGRYYLAVPIKTTTQIAESQGRVVALDPGIRSFMTFFAEDSCGHLGHGDFGRVQRLCAHLDDLLSRLDKGRKEGRVGAKSRYRMRKAAGRLRQKILDLIDELHWKVARFLVDNFDIILLPTFETRDMSSKVGRKLRKKSVRSMLTFAHHRFKQRLKHKAFEMGKVVYDVNEAYTSKTASWTGEIFPKLGGRKAITSNGIKVDRDINGARGIFLRALVDTPSLREALSIG